MAGMTEFSSKTIFIGNVKGGVGKSTLTVYLTDYLRRRFPTHRISAIDTDPQGTAFELLEPVMPEGAARFVPVGDRFDGVNLSTLDGVLRQLLSHNAAITMVDTGGGQLGSFWRMMSLSSALVVPTSMSWTDLRPTIEFIKEIDERKVDFNTLTPHVIVVPNRVSPNQRNFRVIADALSDVNVVLAPPISELVVARGYGQEFGGMTEVNGTRFHQEIARLGDFLIEFVISGKLDEMYSG
jgi:MinD-like ATPase involved in chromosome partitioning or flagellar assembly